MLGDNDWIKTRFTVPGNIQGDISNISLQGFLAKAVQAVITRLFLGLVLLITKVIIQLRLGFDFFKGFFRDLEITLLFFH